MKLRRIKARIKPLKGVNLIYIPEENDNTSIIETFQGMGYLVYEDPTDCGYSNIIVSDRTVTYGDLKKLAKRFEIDLDWWNDDTDFNDRLDLELEEA